MLLIFHVQRHKVLVQLLERVALGAGASLVATAPFAVHTHALAGHGVVRRQKLPDEPLQQQRPCGYERDNILTPEQQEHASIPQFPSRLGEPKLARAFPDLDDRHERCTVSIGRATKAACQ